MLTDDQYKQYGHMAFFCLLVAVVLYSPTTLQLWLPQRLIEMTAGGDFKLFYHVSEHLSTLSLYAPRKLHLTAPQFYYSPLFAITIHPLTWMPVEVALLTWRILLLVCLVRSFILCLKLCRVPPTYEALLLILIVAMALSVPLSTDWGSANVTGLILWMAMESYALLARGKEKLAALLLALAINFKLLLLPLLVYYAWRGYRRFALWVVLLSVVFLLLPAVVFGWERNTALLAEWWEALSGHTLLARTYASIFWVKVTQAGWLLTERGSPLFSAIVYLSIAFLVGYTLYILRHVMPCAKPSPIPPYEVGYILLIIPFIYPRQFSYSLLLAMPAIVWVAHCVMTSRKKSVILPALIPLALLMCAAFPYHAFLGQVWPYAYTLIQPILPLLDLFYLLGLLSLIPYLSYYSGARGKAIYDAGPFRQKYSAYLVFFCFLMIAFFSLRHWLRMPS